MTDWPELDALSQKKNTLQKKKEVERQEKLDKVRSRFVEIFLNWDNIIINYLQLIAKETWRGDADISAPYQHLGYETDIGYGREKKEYILRLLDNKIEDQLHGKESVFKWRADSREEYAEYYFHVKIHFKNFSPNKIVVEGSKSHITRKVHEKEFKKVLLLVFNEGPGRGDINADITGDNQRVIIYSLLKYVFPIVLLVTEFLLFILSMILFFRGNSQSAIFVLLICAYISLVSIRFAEFRREQYGIK
jgi:hypothetical protein